MLSAWRGALLLLVAFWSCGAIPSAGGQPAGSRGCQSECPKFSTKIPLNRLRSYERTKCGKSGVLLITKNNNTFCADPKDRWVQEAMRALDAKNALLTVDTSVTKEPGRFEKIWGSAVPLSAQAVHSAYPRETLSTAAYKMSTFSVMTTEDPKSSAVTSTLAGPQVSKPSTGSTSKPEIIVSRTTMQPELLANRSTPSYFTDGPKSFGEGLVPVGGGLENISGSPSDLVGPPTSLGTSATEAVDDEGRKVSPTQSTLHSSSTTINLLKRNSTSNDKLQPSSDRQDSAIKQVTENSTLGFSGLPQNADFTSLPGTHNGSKTNSAKNKSDILSVPGEAAEAPLSTQASRDAFSKPSGTLSASGLHGEATTPSPDVSLPFLPSALARYRNHIISVIFLGFAFCIYLSITGLCAKSCIRARASSTEMVLGLTYSKTDPRASAYAMQVL